MYTFTSSHPPLLQEYPDPRSFSEQELTFIIGTKKWTESFEVQPDSAFYFYDQTSIDITATRSLIWQLNFFPLHFADGVNQKTTITKGYDITTMQMVENTITTVFESKINFPKDFLSFLSRSENTLKITNETRQTWKVSEETTVTQDFESNRNYAIWNLLDVINLDFVSKKKLVSTPSKNILVKVYPETTSKTQVSCIIGSYQDK